MLFLNTPPPPSYAEGTVAGVKHGWQYMFLVLKMASGAFNIPKQAIREYLLLLRAAFSRPSRLVALTLSCCTPPSLCKFLPMQQMAQWYFMHTILLHKCFAEPIYSIHNAVFAPLALFMWADMCKWGLLPQLTLLNKRLLDLLAAEAPSTCLNNGKLW